MNRDIKIYEPDAAQRRIYFHLVGLDGITPALTEAGGQPQISINGAAFTNTGIGTLVAIGFGRYYAELTTSAINAEGLIIETRYKSANTAEIPGDSVQIVGTDFNGLVAQSGIAAAGSTTTTFNLETTASTTDSIYNGDRIIITNGTGKGQSRNIITYVGATRVATLSTAWSVTPDTTSTYAVLAENGARLNSDGRVSVLDVQNVTGNVNGSVGSLSATAQTNVQSAMTTQGYTAARAGYLDTLNGLVANIWTSATRTLTAFGFGVTVSTNNDKAGYSLTSAEHTLIGTDAATGILVTPSQKIATNVSNQVVASSVQGNVTGSVASVTGAVGSVTGAVGSVSGAVTVGTNNDKAGYALTAGEHTAIASDAASGVLVTPGQRIATNATNQVVASSVQGNVTGSVASVTGSVGSVSGSVASVTGAVGSVTGNVGGNVVGSVGSLAAQARTDVENTVWNAARSGHVTAGSYGEGISSVQGNVTGSVGSVTGNVGGVSGTVTVGTNNDKTGYSLTSGVNIEIANAAAAAILVTPANKLATNASNQVVASSVTGNVSGSVGSVTGSVGSVTGAVTVGTNNDKTGYALSAGEHTIIGTDAATAILVTPANKISTNLVNQVVASSVQGNVTGTVASVTGSVASVTGAVGSVTGAVGSVTGNVGGNVVGSVGSLGTTAQANVQTAMGAQGYTTARAGYMDVLNGLVANIWASSTRTLTAFGFNVTASSVTDKTGYSLTAAEHTAIQTDVTSGLTTQGYTTARAGYLDTLNGLVSNIWTSTTRTLTAFGFNVTVATNNDKLGYGLSTAEREASATVVEAHLLNEGDSQMLINAITSAIGAANMDEVALVAAIRADIERNGGTLASIFADYARRTGDYATVTEMRANLDANRINVASVENYNEPGDLTATIPFLTAIDNIPTYTNTAIRATPVPASLDATERGNIAASVWSATTRTITGAGTLAADVATAVWGATTRTLSSFGFNVTVGTNNDKLNYGLSTTEHTAVRTDVQTAMTTQGYTTGRAGYMDTLNGLVTAIWGAGTRTLTALGFNVTVGTNLDKTGYSLNALESMVQASGTATAGNANSLTLAVGSSAMNDFYKYSLVKIHAGKGAGQVRIIRAYIGSTRVATVDMPWVDAPDATSQYAVLAFTDTTPPAYKFN